MIFGILNVLFICKMFEFNIVKIEELFCKVILIIDVIVIRLLFLIFFKYVVIF